tara:strand:+ start:156 stop:950 length:795 start_codon:yes stop_codon:yes gene_type:complete
LEDYNYKQLASSYKKLGINKYSVIYLKSNLKNIGIPEQFKKNNILKRHFEVLNDVIDFSKQTIVVNTSSTYLCNTSKPFNINKTEGENGILSNYIRRQEKTYRSNHPFISYSAIGKDSKYITSKTSKFSFGDNTPEKRMLNNNTICVCLGIKPRLSCTTIHQIEYEKHVPYRYIKEFNHPIINNLKIKKEKFYMHVLYKDMFYKRDRNKKIFQNFQKKVKEIPLGRDYIYSYDLANFYNHACDLFDQNIYIWLKNEPKKKPFIK